MKKEVIFKQNTISVMQVFHDEWCMSNTKKGRNANMCDCSPDINIVETDGTKESIEASLGVKPENE